ncbi:M14 family metallopeptidase [Flavobacterium gawalongense]|uniref:Peptidase M14 n=1 Tax=Flavobacterium gawalongense TaxID=2594432 RepID=A0A553BG83_9FLAO|nr:M14 metallopeptidase family protein [Flavobacterium gawalongense]TRW99901.1 peptidase M14 [Flavobacterium gawalongense]TRX04365.1 peptidase M14 [Flavobacterium gawalongense]TRX07246.1 peptidase M14 [Flavobacterium gawalongense]TRX07997.1 peptidase M14 [Flavobacterium gawalongense]TRX24249.1 peptidase M14 [Flavobacterium gawalongense]
MNLEELFNQYKEESIQGRYITLDSIEPLLQKINTNNQLKIIGKSVLGKPVYSYQIGEGETKIFLWSQMHGNESTTTKALFDFLNVLNSGSDLAKQLLRNFTFCSIPMLNPDGATLYTRENANKVDLNRDSQNLSQPESKILRETFESFKPDYCFNLHDQRTIFGVSDTGKPATLSFLAPSYNEEREINESRLKAINLIAGINEVLQQYLPNQIGRFDDSFNINCIGDTFQSLGVSTLLFEAGHFANDYDREETRKFVFMALVSSFTTLCENVIVGNGINKYLNIPQNKVVFYDLMYKNIKINYDGIEIITNFAAQYKEELIENQICFNAYISQIGELENHFGHYVYDAKGALYKDDYDNFPKLNQKADFYLDNNIKFVNGMIKI